MYKTIIKDISSYEYVNILIFVCLIGQGKMQISQGKIREKSGNFDILCEWQPKKTKPTIFYTSKNLLDNFIL